MECRALKNPRTVSFLTNILANLVQVSHAKGLLTEWTVTTEEHGLGEKQKFPKYMKELPGFPGQMLLIRLQLNKLLAHIFTATVKKIWTKSGKIKN